MFTSSPRFGKIKCDINVVGYSNDTSAITDNFESPVGLVFGQVLNDLDAVLLDGGQVPAPDGADDGADHAHAQDAAQLCEITTRSI